MGASPDTCQICGETKGEDNVSYNSTKDVFICGECSVADDAEGGPEVNAAFCARYLYIHGFLTDAEYARAKKRIAQQPPSGGTPGKERERG